MAWKRHLSLMGILVWLVSCSPGAEDEIVPPASPQLQVKPQDGAAIVSWSAVEKAAYYNIYWADSTGVDPANGNKVERITTPSYQLDGLANGVKYHLIVTAVNRGGETASNEYAVTPMSPPAMPVVTGIPVNKAVTLEWEAVSGAESYNLYVAQNPAISLQNYTELTDGAKFTSVSSPFEQTPLVNGEAYYYVLTAVNESGETPAATVKVVPTRILQVAAGARHNCAIQSDHTLWCWGDNSYGQLGTGTTLPEQTSPARVGNERDWLNVVVGENHSCAKKSDHSLWCWGSNEYGQLGYGFSGNITFRNTPVQVGTDTDWKNIEVGHSHSCAIKQDESLWCWGNIAAGQLGAEINVVPRRIGMDSDWLSIALGWTESCAIKTNGSLWCWDASLQELTLSDHSLPIPVGETTDWASISAGNAHYCALKANGTLWCWGDNLYGQSGEGNSSETSPVQVTADDDWVAVMAGGWHTCALKDNGSLWCWGLNLYGQLNHPESFGRAEPVQFGEGHWEAASAGAIHNCAFKVGGELYCRGNNWFSQLGVGIKANKTVPSQVGKANDWRYVMSGSKHSCAIKTDGSLWCWGLNDAGRLGDATSHHRAEPVRVAGEHWDIVGLGDDHSCAIKMDGSLWCWGNNWSGQLGLGANAIGLDTFVPQRVDESNDWSTITAGNMHSCSVDIHETLACWGDNSYGQLGNGSTEMQLVPMSMENIRWHMVAVGGWHSCGVQASDRSLWCWGNNWYGQLGNGNFGFEADETLPMRVASDTGWEMIAAGFSYHCGIKMDGSLWCWGGPNDYGELGNGSNGSETQVAPVPVKEIGPWLSIAAGASHTCGVKTDNSLWCWGYNRDGQLGSSTGEAEFSSIPLQVGQTQGWDGVSVGEAHTCATKNDKSLWCWGSNFEGQLGDGSAWSATSPAIVFPE